MKPFAIGFFFGILLCVSLIELVHKTVEVERRDVCSVIYNDLTKQWHPNFAHSVKVTYKLFAWPMKTLWIYFSDETLAVRHDYDEEWTFETLQVERWSNE